MIITLMAFDPETKHTSGGTREVKRIPAVGEHLMISEDAPWFKVLFVLHKLYPNGVNSEADVYAIKVDRIETLTEAGYLTAEATTVRPE
jgi:hypothetical protein